MESKVSKQRSKALVSGEEAIHPEGTVLGTDMDGDGDQESLDEIFGGAGGEVEQQPTVRPQQFWPELEKIFNKAGQDWRDITNFISSFGPGRTGPNILVDRRPGTKNSYVKKELCLLTRLTQP